MIKMAKVRKIHSKPLFASSVPVARPQSGSTPGCLRVAAYARVSTDAEEQKNSFDAQKDYYKKLIEKTDGWIFSGIYADYGITGTSAEQRPGFQKLMEDCRAGKIDRILTKFVSRFARNTVDSLMQSVN